MTVTGRLAKRPFAGRLRRWFAYPVPAAASMIIRLSESCGIGRVRT